METNKYTKVAAHGLIRKGNSFLVTRRAPDDDYMPEYWDVPGGTLDFGEDLLDALKREIKEEIGLKVKIGPVISVCGYLSNPSRHQFQITYACEYISGEINLDLAEHDEYRWVTIKELGKLKRIGFLDQLYKELKKSA